MAKARSWGKRNAGMDRVQPKGLPAAQCQLEHGPQEFLSLESGEGCSQDQCVTSVSGLQSSAF